MKGTRRTSLLRMGAVALLLPVLPIVLLWMQVDRYITDWSRDSAIHHAAASARLVADVAVTPELVPDDFVDGADPERLAGLDRSFAPVLGDQISRIKIWGADGLVVYSDATETIGRTYPITDSLDLALAGSTATEISDATDADNDSEADLGTLVEAYVPLDLDSNGTVDGAFEFYLPFEPIQQTISNHRRAVLGEMVLLLFFLYLALVATSLSWLRSRREAEAREHEANHDPLTGLPNRRHLDAILARPTEHTRSVGVVFVDLDDFKQINDQFGHAVGDQVLCAVSERLRRGVRPDATVARLGGDEFAILVPGVASRAEAANLGDRLIDALADPIVIGAAEFRVRASIGIDLADARTLDPELVKRNADVAMYVAKESGKCRHATFDPRLHGHLQGDDEPGSIITI